LEDDLLFKAATGFGHGIGTPDSLCGIIPGAVLVIGLKYGRGREDPKNAGKKAYLLSKELLRWFEKEFGSHSCRVLRSGAGRGKTDKLSALGRTRDQRCAGMAQETAVKLIEMMNR
jgi:C_GCAxxG_C_C family probable redox protein